MKTARMLFFICLILAVWPAHRAGAASPLANDPLLSSATASLSQPLPVNPTHTDLSSTYSVTISAKGSHDVESIQIAGNQGTIRIRGVDYPTFIQEQIPWPAQRVTLYQGFAFDANHWKVYWAYCSNSHRLTSFWFESSDDPAVVEDTSVRGSCVSSSSGVTSTIDLPPLSLIKAKPVTGFSIDGPEIYLPSGGLGIMNIEGEHLVFLPFSVVNCTTCEVGHGWYELHSLFWNETQGRACFGIFYLEAANKNYVHLAHSQCLPDLERPLDRLSTDAQWSKTDVRPDSPIPSVRPMPWPQ